MLHLRIICPAEVRDRVIADLRDTVGVTHIVVDAGAAIDPIGDVISADVTRESANTVLDQLTELGLPRDGAITMESLTTVLSDSADKAEKDAPGDPDDAVIWEELSRRTSEDATLSWAFISFITLACLIAGVGVVTNSPVTIVGAMVVGPEFGPLAGIAVAIIQRRYDLARRSMLALLVGFPLAIGVTTLGALAAEAAGWVTLGSLRDAHQVDFVYQVGPFSFVVALLAGAAGMLSLVSAKSSALIGVFISVTTVPAAGYAAIAATLGEWRIALESVGQLGVNLVGIVIAGVAVLAIARAAQNRVERSDMSKRQSLRWRDE